MDRHSTKLLNKLILLTIAMLPATLLAHRAAVPHNDFAGGFAHVLTSWEHLLLNIGLGYLAGLALTQRQALLGKLAGVSLLGYGLLHLGSLTFNLSGSIGLLTGFGFAGLLGYAANRLGDSIGKAKMHRVQSASTLAAILLLTLI